MISDEDLRKYLLSSSIEDNDTKELIALYKKQYTEDGYSKGYRAAMQDRKKIRFNKERSHKTRWNSILEDLQTYTTKDDETNRNPKR